MDGSFVGGHPFGIFIAVLDFDSAVPRTGGDATPVVIKGCVVNVVLMRGLENLAHGYVA